ncbi:MAG: magnesium/cobalt transporter CorA [Planctomycetota bacterium]|jgi:magnesium transporter
MGKKGTARSKKAGLPPGTLVYTGKSRSEPVTITIVDYDEKNLEEKEAATVEECFAFKKSPTVTWIDVDGIHDVSIIEKLGSHFEIHPLVLEDLVNTMQRPKFEDFEKYTFTVLKMLTCDEKTQKIESKQVSLILGPNFLLSFQQKKGDVFNMIRQRIQNSKGRIRRMGPDYLAFSLLDAVVDQYFAVLEGLGDRIEIMEEHLLESPDEKMLSEIHGLKREMIGLRKSVWPLREVISGLERCDSSLIKDETRVFLRDLYDHTIQVIEAVETFRDMVSGMLDIYLSSVSNRMNEVMKVLTIFAAIFIPLTFIAGVYGMNFEIMPELKWRYGYLIVWSIMIALMAGMLVYFKRKKWM